MALRMTGLISGMDTESMVSELVKASSSKVDKVKQQKQLLEWKKETWQGLNTKLYNFYKSEASTMRLVSSFRSKKALVSDETKVSVSTASASANGTHSIAVKQLASSAYLTGANIKTRGNSYTTVTGATTSTKFEDMTDANGDKLDLAGKTITITAGNATVDPLTFEIGGAGENGVASIDDINAKLKATSGYEKLSASYVNGKLTFTNASAKKDKDANEVGEIYNVECEALGISGEVGFKKDEDAGVKNTLEASVTQNYVKDFTSADISKTTKLTDIGIKAGTAFTVMGKDFVVDDSTTIEDFTAGLSKLGVNANFDANQGRFYINASATGADYDFDITASDEGALDILGLSASSGATKIDARDAIIEYNGVEYTGSSNTFDLNGLTITAKSVTEGPVNVEISSDVDSIYNTIKNFVKKYNELIDEMNTLYSEKSPEYEPLTDEERSKLSDTQIEQWEKKAKTGILRRDDTINSLLSNMRSMLNQSITVTDKDGNEKKVTLASLGIVTGDYSENGKLHILGDADDPDYASETNKLKEYLEKDPNLVAQAFTGNGTESTGVGTGFYNYLGKAMGRTSTSHSLTFYNDITLDESIDEKEEEIEKWQEKLTALEDKYYEQFSAMEVAMAKLQQQQQNLAALFGTA